MAEFAEVMREWRRMCDVYSTEEDDCCKGCPILELEYDEHGCDAIFSDWANNANWNEVARVVMAWAAENPETVYPTWRDLFERMGANIRCDGTVQFQLFAADKPIPADIAEKLGIQPKEGEQEAR